MQPLRSWAQHQAWPWQIQLAIIMLQPKGSGAKGPSSIGEGGDRALALLPWMARTWGLMHKQEIQQWAKDVEEPFDAAVAGNSSLREAMVRALGDETADAMQMPLPRNTSK